MTDRINSFTVVLDKDLRDDDIESIVTALRMTKHVIGVTPNVAGYPDTVARMRTVKEVTETLMALIRELNKLPD